MNPWIEHVKRYALANNVSYKQSLRDSKSSYTKKLGGTIMSDRDMEAHRLILKKVKGGSLSSQDLNTLLSS
jgi:hypothetical protein